MKFIEFVCQGNISRSKTAQSVGRRYLENAGLSGEYQITSSGILVDKLKGHDLPYLEVRKHVGAFRSSGVETELFNLFDQAVQSGNARSIEEYKAKVIDFMVEEEIRRRNHSFGILNIPQIDHPELRYQTVPLIEVHAVIPLNRTIKVEVERIYTNHPNRPKIESFDVLASGNPEENEIGFSGDHTKLWDEYHTMIAHIAEQTPLVINAVI